MSSRKSIIHFQYRDTAHRKWTNFAVAHDVCEVSFVSWKLMLWIVLIDFRLLIAAPLSAVIFLALIEAQAENQAFEGNLGNITQNATLEFTCSVGNNNYTKEECLEGLGKFGRIVGYIVMGFLLIVFACCCGCCCCICKAIHGKKSQGGQVFRPANQLGQNHTITTIA